MKKDLFVTFLAEFVVLLSGIIVYKLAANLLGPEGFSEYALCRRVVSFIHPVLLVGLGIGIPRYIAYAQSYSEEKVQDSYFIAGISIIIVVIVIFTLLSNTFSDLFANLFFGNSKYINLIFPINLMLIGLLLHAACYAYFRGKLLMIKANLFQIITMGFVPILVFKISREINQILALTGVIWVIISFFVLLLIIKDIRFDNMYIFPYAKKLLSFGIQRLPGEFGLAGLLTLPAIFTAHMASVKEAGYVAFGISLFNMIGAAFAPIGLILLPKASILLANKDRHSLRYYICIILIGTVFLTVLGVITFEIFADKIIVLYLGKGYEGLIYIVRIIIISSLAYTIYVTMRSVIDAYYEMARNTVNIFIALCVFLLTSGLLVLAMKSYIALVYSFCLSIFCLGILTVLEIRKIVDIDV